MVQKSLKSILESITDSFKNSPLLWGFMFLILILYFFMLGDRPLATPDEGRYVEIPREMIASGDFITPRLNGLKYFEKPVLFYWMQTLILSLTNGIQEGMLRLWPCLSALFFALGFFKFLKKEENETIAFGAVAVLLTTPVYFWLSRTIILDIVFTIFL